MMGGCTRVEEGIRVVAGNGGLMKSGVRVEVVMADEAVMGCREW